MQIASTVIQIIIAVGIFNVWLFRFGKPTEFRGGDANSLKEEFQVYGLPVWFMYLVGTLKILLAILLIVGIWVPYLVSPAAIGMAILMVGAIAMHIKVKDSLKKSTPATVMLILSLFVAFI